MNNTQRRILGVYTAVIGDNMAILGRNPPNATIFTPDSPVGLRQEKMFKLLKRHLTDAEARIAIFSSLEVAQVNEAGYRVITFKDRLQEFKVSVKAHPYHTEQELFEEFDLNYPVMG
ncbi:hypothetical protein EMPS_11583 [Entomortierella parvispora]|uniref:Uncharacterized protein n=1 Tax=Entomortierella parvispora TaxID=205924 RepID=A0A9P3M2G1_9FUNG|nr:hypothetical protein EMPS_11583 [Entomortierella parvispora]